MGTIHWNADFDVGVCVGRSTNAFDFGPVYSSIRVENHTATPAALILDGGELIVKYSVDRRAMSYLGRLADGGIRGPFREVVCVRSCTVLVV